MTPVTNNDTDSQSVYSTPTNSPRGRSRGNQDSLNDNVQKAIQKLASGTTTIQATPSAEEPSKASAGMGSAQSVKDANFYRLENYEVRWKGKKYLLSIDFPCRNWQKLSNKTALEGEARRFAELFVADLLTNLNQDTDHTIKPGDDFEILFDENGEGYTAFVPAPGCNPETQPLSKIKEDSGRWVEANQASSQALSKHVRIDSSNFEKFGENLTTDPALESLRATVNNKASQTALNAAPTNLAHRNSNCFINSAFQQLVHEPNEEIRNALRDPQNYIGGENNRLLKAIRKYDLHQASGQSGKCDIESLGWEDRFNGDAVLDGASKFIQFFNTEEINKNESLKKFLEVPNQQLIAEDLSLQQAAQNSLTSSELPDVLNVYTPRLTNSEKFSELFNENRLRLIDIYNDLKKGLDENLDLDSLNNLFKEFKFDNDSILEENTYREMLAKIDVNTGTPEDKQYKKTIQTTLHKYYYRQYFSDIDAFGDSDEDVENQKIEKIKTILDTEPLYHGAIYFLSEQTRKQIAEIRAKNLEVTAITTPIEIADNGKVTVTKDQTTATYELTSFLAYKYGDGKTGHYVTYLRKGDQCWILDDLKGAEPERIKDINTFVQAARTKGCYYRLHKAGSLPNSTQADQHPQKESAISKIPEEEIEQTGVTYSEDEGSMESAHHTGFTLINPTNPKLKAIHPQLQTLRTLTQEAYDSALKTDASWYQYFSKPIFNWGFMPKPLLISNVLFTPTDPLKSEEQVKEATKKALESATKLKKPKLAFPVFECQGQTEESIVSWMKSAIKEFITENHHKWLNGGKIKIIRPKKPESQGNISPSVEEL